MSNSNDRKNQTLGMPHGTAANRLRKILLFNQLKKHSENVCARCGKSIETVDELSIEHLKPWEGISAELFWDLNNVAFSHLFCNRPHRYNDGLSRRNSGPEGTEWCNTCKRFEPRENFHRHSGRWNGVQKTCMYNRRDRPSQLDSGGLVV